MQIVYVGHVKEQKGKKIQPPRFYPNMTNVTGFTLKDENKVQSSGIGNEFEQSSEMLLAILSPAINACLDIVHKWRLGSTSFPKRTYIT